MWVHLVTGVAESPALRLEATPPGTYRQRGTHSLQRLFRSHFAEFAARFKADYARRLGHSRLQRITRAVARFVDCGNYPKGVARIRCTDPDCRAEYFRPSRVRSSTLALPALRSAPCCSAST